MKILITFIIVINILLAASQLVLAWGRSADGVTVAHVRQRQQALQLLNQQLAESVYTKSSLPYVASQSAHLGLVAGSVRFVNPQITVAAARLSP